MDSCSCGRGIAAATITQARAALAGEQTKLQMFNEALVRFKIEGPAAIFTPVPSRSRTIGEQRPDNK
jgi:hypothetical protein